MGPGARLALRQEHKLVMSHQLRQAIELLQLPVLELQARLERELVENPCLEVRDEVEDEVPPGPPDRTAPDPRDLGGRSAAAAFREDWWDYFGQSGDRGSQWVSEPAAAAESHATEPVSDYLTLRQHLRHQLGLSPTSDPERRAAEFLIDQLDDNGYLRGTLPGLARDGGWSVQLLERALKLVQSFDPPGVAARDLVECLDLQLQARGCQAPLVLAIARDHLDDVAGGRLGRVADACGVPRQAVEAAVGLLRQLDPKPGRRFGPGENRCVVPDVTVERVGGEHVVVLNEGVAPRLMINPTYQSLLEQGAALEPATRRFLERRLQSALWLIRAIEQRRLTLYRVSEVIVSRQRAFLEREVPGPVPMTLRDVADATGLHESTVSRATAGKYLQTPRGVFPFRFLFSPSLGGGGAGPVSAEHVRRLIRELVASEDPRRPVSDARISKVLSARGVRVARRTVAKYRAALGIPGSAGRRRP